MGRAAKLRRGRQLERRIAAHHKAQAQTMKKPCDTCAFRDPSAWVSDQAMANKVIHCLSTPQRNKFFCHEGMPQGGEEGIEYLPPLTPEGKPDARQMTPCGGFARWAVPYRLASFAVQMKAVLALQLRMLTLWLQGDDEHVAELRVACGGRADIMQRALNAETLVPLPEDYGE